MLKVVTVCKNEAWEKNNFKKKPNMQTYRYDFKLKGGQIFKGRYSYLLPLCYLTVKWSNFFPIDRISGLEKYVMFQH